MPDVLSESVLTLAEATRSLPTIGGQPLHPSTIFRWVTKGVRVAGAQRLKLEAARLGSRIVTSREALARFTASLQTSAVTPEESSPPPPRERHRPRSRSRRQRDIAAAERRLAEAGV